MFNWKKYFAIKQKFDENYCWIQKRPGIYLWTREENGLTYFYVGQAKNLNQRRFQYYEIQCGLNYPSRHFEASLKKHKDWRFQILKFCEEKELDCWEKYFIDKYNALPNHITRNTMIANQDIVRSNFKRKDQIENKLKKNIKSLLKRVDINCEKYGLLIEIRPKVNKNGLNNQNSVKAYQEIENWIKEITNGKN